MKCKICLEDIHPLRLKALPNTRTCVEHSDVSIYRAITTVKGKGDHTWNDVEFVDDKTYEKYEEERRKRKIKFKKIK